jgi:ubiquinone/menaquinone biosynthesis C-methylase UbiE
MRMPYPIASIDYGYPWWLSYGHIPFLAAALAFLALGYYRKWSLWAMVPIGLIGLWAGAAFLVTRCVIDVNGRAELPTQKFLASGTGRVLDVGAGTGRSTIMVLQARPHVTVVASDLFGASFEEHFGKTTSPQQKLLDNLKAAGVDGRATIATADMLKLPFDDSSFDGVVSAYAMDHVNRAGSDQAIHEAARVLKPGGDFLLMVVASEPWAHFAFGPLLAHSGARGTNWWVTHVQKAGLQVLEFGIRPLTFYVLARKTTSAATASNNAGVMTSAPILRNSHAPMRTPSLRSTISHRIVASDPVTDKFGPRSTPISTASRTGPVSRIALTALPASRPDGRLFMTLDSAAMPKDAASAPPN